MKKLALAVVTVAVAALTACGPGTAAPLIATAEAEALAAMGVDQADLAAAEATAPPAQDGDRDKTRWERRHRAKVLLARNVLHGEAVVQTKDGGTVTVMVQRGEVTAIDADSVTVKSSDGFTLTWTFHENLRVFEKRASIQPSEVKVGAKIALAGPKEGDQPQARLIIIPLKP